MTQTLRSAWHVAADLIAFVGPANLAAGLIALNLSTFAAFGLDKARAERGLWRVRESTLLYLAFVGGSPGAWAGRSLFRHKTRKQPFNNHLMAISLLQVVALGAWIGWAIDR